MTPTQDDTTSDNTLPAAQDTSVTPAADDQSRTQQAAANIVRSQIDHIYDGSSEQQTEQPQQAEPENPYERTHQENVHPVLEQWAQYHSAWQTYYQKYYEGYYTHHLQQAAQSLQAHVQPTPEQPAQNGYFVDQPDDAPEDSSEIVTKDEALLDLRQKLLTRVSESAKKVRKSRHFVPIAAAILVMLIFVALQYNQLIVGTVMAYVSPGNINPQDIVLNPSSNVTVSPDPRLIIPKINVDAPVFYGIGNDYNSQMAAMAKGIADFAIPGASSLPGQVGNLVLAGHSSNDLFDTGDYKFIFAQLGDLQPGDSIYVNYNSVRYTYTVTKQQVVAPDDVAALVYPTTKPILTLLTCTPVGTSKNRLLVIAQQVSPDPTAATAAPASTNAKSTSQIPGTSQTLLEQLFGS